MRNRLPKMPYKKECGIINMDNDSGPGTHWVAYYTDDNIITLTHTNVDTSV